VRTVRVKVNGEALQNMLARKNMSQSDLARQLGLSTGGLSQFIKGIRCPSAPMRRKLMRRLKKDMTFDELFIIEVHRDGRWERVR